MKEHTIIKIINPTVINPFFWYVFFWIISLFLYQISPSQLNMPLAKGTKIFLYSTILISMILFLFVNKYLRNKSFNLFYIRPSIIGTCMLWGLFLLDFLYSRQIPLLTNNYTNFGFPTLHVVAVTFGTYYSIRSIFQFLIYRQRIDAMVSIFILLYFILIFSRGLILFILSAGFIGYLATKKIRFRQIIFVIIIFIIGSWLFGVLGNIRAGYNWNDTGYLLSLSKIKADRYSLLSPFYWVEEYFICSLRNLNFNILQQNVEYSFSKFLYYLIPDFISKRFFPNQIESALLEVPEYTTVTMYANVYVYLGYLGMIINYILYVLIDFIILLLKNKNGLFKIEALSIISYIFALSIFGNLMIYSGISFSLIVIIIVILVKPYKYKIVMKR